MLLGPQIVRKDSENPKASRDLVYEDEKKKKKWAGRRSPTSCGTKNQFFFSKKRRNCLLFSGYTKISLIQVRLSSLKLNCI